MECVQLRIPPLPQFLTIGHTEWLAGMQHFERIFHVYDLLLVCEGALYMTENGIPYTIAAGELLLLEPGLSHVGHLPCREATEIYWVHFKHEPPVRRLPEKQLPLSVRVREGTDQDQSPVEQFLFLPKHGSYDLKLIRPLLDEMLDLRRRLVMGQAVEMQVLLGRLLTLLQLGLRTERTGSGSSHVAQQVMDYLREHQYDSFHAGNMSEALHFDPDYAARCLRRHTGMSPVQYHHMLRLEEVKRLLLGSKLPLREISATVGYKDYNYFIRSFKQAVGVTPGAFRRASAGYM